MYTMGSSRPVYRKRAGPQYMFGQLYETKLLSLLYFRAIHDDSIEEFQLASSVDKIGVFDGICFKAKVKGFAKPVALFIQTKHRGEKKKQLKIDLATYFNSYMKIRKYFDSSDSDIFFRGTFNETECLFVVYTTTQVDFTDDSVGSRFSDKLHYLIDTGGTVKQPHKDENNIEYLTKIAVKNQVTSLAERMAKFITEKKYFPMMLTDEYVLLYHVVLARQVFDLSEIQPDGYRIASFRNDFFDNNEEHIIIFKDTLFKEVLKKRRIEPADVNNLLLDYFAEPTDIKKLSKLIGTVINNNNGRLEYDEQSIKDFELVINPMNISLSTVDEAVKLAAREILSFQKFIVPAAFGNKDLTIRGSDAKIKNRINYLTSKMKSLLHNLTYGEIVTIDETLDSGFLRLNGGIAGAVGNIFVLDDNTKLMKITDNWESLGTLAKRLYTELNSEIHNLHEYKFSVKVDKFPKLSFGCSQYEENLVRHYLDKLLFYCNQANEQHVGEILKCEIAQHYQHNQPHYYQVETDAIFSKYHSAVQQWWTQTQESYSLTREPNLFRQSLHDIIEDPLMTSINLIYRSKIQQYNYTFTEDAVRSLNLQDQHSSTVIVAQNSVLTVAKVLQYLKNKIYHVVLDLEYITNLPINDRNALRSELNYTNEAKVLILVCDKIDSTNEIKTLEDIAEAVRYKRTIIITNQTSLPVINKYFPKADGILHDKNLSLIDMSKISQKRILETATVIFQSVEIRLDLLLKGWRMSAPRSVGTAAAVAASAVADQEAGGSLRIADAVKLKWKGLLTENVSEETTPQQAADATDLMFLAFARDIKSFSPRRQSDIKFKIAQLIREEELGHIRVGLPTVL